MLILIIIGVLIITLLAYALRLLMLIYVFFSSKGKEDAIQERGGLGSLTGFIKSASVIELILFFLRNRGRFKR